MRIALSIEHFEPARGGGETYCCNLARLLVNAGHDVHVFALGFDANEAGVTFHRLQAKSPLAISRRYSFAQRAKEQLMKEDFDVIQGFGKSVYADVLRPGGGVHRAWLDHQLRATWGASSRVGIRIRQKMSMDRHLVCKLEEEQFGPGRSHAIIAVSHMVKNEIIGYYGCEAERVHVVYNGVDLGRFTPELRHRHRTRVRNELGMTDQEMMLLFLGHNYKRKGLHALVRALRLVRERNQRFRLVVVGKGRRATVDRLAERLGVTAFIQYAGSTNAPERYYAAADIFCCPSYYDPCANVVLEALACGLPVVTSTANGSGELLSQGREGYVVDPDDAEAMAACIIGLFCQDKRKEASQSARTLAESRSIGRNFCETIQLYDRVVHRKRSTGRSAAGLR